MELYCLFEDNSKDASVVGNMRRRTFASFIRPIYFWALFKGVIAKETIINFKKKEQHPDPL
jgi:hypothetical protein